MGVRIDARRPIWLAALALACVSPPPPPVVPAWNTPGATIVVEADERALWAKSERELAKLAEEDDDVFFHDEKLTAYLERVAAGLLPAALPAEMPRPRVRVIRSAERNAGAMPGGVVLVSDSLLATLADEAQLAGLFGHELAHLLARHALIQTRYEAISASTVQRMELSRAQEDEADRLGLALMQGAGYEPRGVAEMLVVLEQDEPERHPNRRFESHPFLSARASVLRGLVRDSPGGRREAARYEAAIADLLLAAAETELAAGHFERADAAIARHLRLRPESGRGYYWKAEHERRVDREGRLSPRARDAYERAVELAPDDPDALRALGFLYREAGEQERARELFTHYLRVAPDAADRKLIERYLGR